MIAATLRWIDRNILDLGREMRLSYLPPLMVYVAAGISGLTGIVGTFFVKDYLGLSAAFLAALGFWAGIPWALKMPLGHLVDLIWRWKSGLVYLGAGLIAASLLIMVGLLADRAAMRAIMPAEAWFVLSALLAPVGYVLQDVVADAMTVEAVPRVDEDGKPIAAGSAQAHAHDHADAGARGDHRRQRAGRGAQRLPVRRRGAAVRSGRRSRDLPPRLPARAGDPGRSRCWACCCAWLHQARATRGGSSRRAWTARAGAKRCSTRPRRPPAGRTGGSSAAAWRSSPFSLGVGLRPDPVQPGDHLRRLDGDRRSS